MTPKQANQPTGAADAGELKKAVDRETGAAKDALGKAGDAARQEASRLGADATDAGLNDAEGAKQEVSAGLHDFSAAVRSAGEKLAESDQGMAARLVQEAASGLERLSSSLGKKQLQDIVDDVRDFGRRNPTAFIVGSVLAGLALGRFVRSTDDDATTATARAHANGASRTGKPLGEPGAIAKEERDEPEH